MNILLSGEHGEAEAYFKVPGHRKVAADDLLLYSLEVTGAGGYWVEFSRALIQGKPSATTQKMADAYPHAMESARKLMRHGELASTVHRTVADIFAKHGFALGHLSGHSIGTTMLEYPAIGANSDVPLEENMIFSLASAGRRSGWQSLPLHARHLSHRQDRRRMSGRCAVEIF